MHRLRAFLLGNDAAADMPRQPLLRAFLKSAQNYWAALNLIFLEEPRPVERGHDALNLIVASFLKAGIAQAAVDAVHRLLLRQPPAGRGRHREDLVDERGTPGRVLGLFVRPHPGGLDQW